jgi:cytochrome P450
VEDDLRAWIQSADDTTYTAHIIASTAESPRTEVRDLYGPLNAARNACPVQAKGQSELAGFEDYRTMSAFTERPLFSLLGFEEARRGFADVETLSSTIHNETIGQVWGETLLGMDGLQHRQNRALIAQAFRRKEIDRWRETVIAPIVAGLIDRFAAKGSADLVSELTLLFPVYVIAEMLGLPRADVPEFTAWAADTIVIFHDPAKAFAASKALEGYLSAQIEQRRRDGSDDMIGMLIDAEIEGERLTDLEIISFIRILLPAGAETTFRSTSNLLFALLTQPDQLAALRADRSLLPQAMDEALRWEPPLTALNRISTREVEIAGVTIPPGAIVACNIGAANRDPLRWDDPDIFDLHRPVKSNIAFAFGPHLCLGMHLALFEMQEVVGQVLDRLPDLRLDPAAPAPEIRGIGFRAPLTLPVLFSPQVS